MMNKYQEEYERLFEELGNVDQRRYDAEKICGDNFNDYGEEVPSSNEEWKSLYPNIKELVEKATPKKLNRFYFDNQGYRSFAYRCPICDKHFGIEFSIKEKPNCCPRCAQALDWSEE